MTSINRFILLLLLKKNFNPCILIFLVDLVARIYLNNNHISCIIVSEASVDKQAFLLIKQISSS